MSHEQVKQVIGRAVLDAEFRETLFTDPDKALEGYNLTEEEVSALKEIEREEFQTFSSELEQRVSKAGIVPGDPSQVLGKDSMKAFDVLRRLEER